MRELENVIERASTLSQSGRVSADDLPPEVRAAESGTATPALSQDDLSEILSGLPNIDAMERHYLLRVLEATGSNRKRAAEILGINRKALNRMAARFQLDL